MRPQTAIAILDLVASDVGYRPDDLQQAISTLSNYVTLLEFLSTPETRADARRGLTLLSGPVEDTPGPHQAVVTVLGDEFLVETYTQADDMTFRLAERELARVLRLRFVNSNSIPPRLADVIAAG